MSLFIITLHSCNSLTVWKPFSSWSGMNLCSESLKLTLWIKSTSKQRPVLHSPIGVVYWDVELYFILYIPANLIIVLAVLLHIYIWAASWQNQQNDLRAQRRLRSAWASAQSDQSLRCAQWVAKDPRFLHADSELWSDWADAQTDLGLRWAHSQFVGFVMRWLILTLHMCMHESISIEELPLFSYVVTTAWWLHQQQQFSRGYFAVFQISPSLDWTPSQTLGWRAKQWLKQNLWNPFW